MRRCRSVTGREQPGDRFGRIGGIGWKQCCGADPPGRNGSTALEPTVAETGDKPPAGASRKKESATATAISGAFAAAAVAPEALDSDFRYRLARKNVHIAFANLGQAFQRMMLEPKAQQKFVPELNDLLIRSHVLASQITAAGPLLQSVGKSAAGHARNPCSAR